MFLLVFEPGFCLCKKIEICLPNFFSGIADPNLSGVGLISADNPAIEILEVDGVRHILHKGIQNILFSGELGVRLS